MLRDACGSGDHPDSRMFIQIYRLLCVFSLVNPPRGGNVTGGELLEPLMKDKTVKSSIENNKTWLTELDKAIEDGIYPEPENNSGNDSQETAQSNDQEHDYDVVNTSDEVKAFMSGYVAFKMHRFTICAECRNSMINRNIDNENRYQFITCMSKGYLIYPSEQLFNLISQLEDKILHVVGTNNVHLETLIRIFEEVAKIKNIPLIGCKEHAKILTKKMIEFYITIRGEFIAKSYNVNRDEQNQKTKKFRKLAKQ